jgi:hypothetical protein
MGARSTVSRLTGESQGQLKRLKAIGLLSTPIRTFRDGVLEQQQRVSSRRCMGAPECPLLTFQASKPQVRCREEFRAPAGVRNSPRKEPAGHRRWLWGFRISADVGDGATAVGKLWGECGQTASLRLRAVLSGRWTAGRGSVGVDNYHRRASTRCRRLGACS